MRSLVLFAVLVLLPIFTNAQSTDALQAFGTAVAESREGNHARALESFEATLAIIERDSASDAFFAKVHYNAGVSLYHLDRTLESAIHLEKALSYAKGRHAKSLYLLGVIGLESNDLRLARTALRDAVSLDSRDGAAWYDLSRVYVALDEPVRAKHAFEKAVKNGAIVSRTDAAGRTMATLTAYE